MILWARGVCAQERGSSSESSQVLRPDLHVSRSQAASLIIPFWALLGMNVDTCAIEIVRLLRVVCPERAGGGQVSR